MIGRKRRSSNRGAQLGAPETPAPILKVPFPSMLDGREYVIRDSGGPTERAYVQRNPTGLGGTMVVPMGDTPADRRVRLHEMAHVRWTPVNGQRDIPAGVTWETVNATEDCRMHKRLRESGFGDALDAPLFDESGWDVWRESFEVQADPSNPRNPWPLVEVARATLATHGTAESVTWKYLADEYGFGWVVQATDEMRERHMGANKRRPAWKRTVELATEIDRTFAELEELPTEIKERLREYQPTNRPGKWGAMTIETPTLVERMPARLRQRVKRSTDAGVVPRNWHRLAVDGRVFTQRRYKPGGGCLLIDQSGSMDLEVEQVQAIMARYPAVTIATYAGRGTAGVLRIIAANGMRASDRDCYIELGGNIVDGPALDWLADQEGPRIWVSDGMVTGANQSQAQNLLLEVAQTCKRANIERVTDLTDLLPDWSE